MEIGAAFRYPGNEINVHTGSRTVLVVARGSNPRGQGKMVLGYRLYERGVFRLFGRHHSLGSDLIFGHYVEVLPEFRGRRIAVAMTTALEDYCLRHGIRKYVGFIGLENAQSLKTAKRAGREIVGRVERVWLCGGWIEWETPWEKIEEMLET